jgi:hypothetical protein
LPEGGKIALYPAMVVEPINTLVTTPAMLAVFANLLTPTGLAKSNISNQSSISTYITVIYQSAHLQLVLWI